MKFLLSLSIIPLLLLTNVSAAEDLPLPTQEEENFPLHTYENPTTEDGLPLLATLEDEVNYGTTAENRRKLQEIVQYRANNLCVSLGHKQAGIISHITDIQYNFTGKAYLEGNIVDVTTRWWGFFSRDITTNAIFKTLRCIK